MVKWHTLFLMALLASVLAVHVSQVNVNEGNYYWDEVVFLHLADNIQEGSYQSSLDEGYRPPLFPFLLSFFGQTYGHWFILALVFLSLLCVYLLGVELFNKHVGLIAAIILGSMPLYFFYSFKLLTEPLSFIWILLAFLMVVKYQKSERRGYLYWLAFFCGLALLTRYLSLIAIGSIFLYLLFRYRWREGFGLSAGIFILTISPLFILGTIYYEHPLGMLLSNLLDNTTATGSVWHYTQHFFEIIGFFVPALFLLGLKEVRRMKPILLFMPLYFVAISLLSQHYDRFFLLLFPFFAVIAAKGVHFLDKWKLGSLFLTVWVVLSLFSGVQAVQDDKDNTRFLIETVQNLDLNGSVMSNSPAYFHYFAGVEAVNFPGDFEQLDPVDYVVVDTYHPRYDVNYTVYVSYLSQGESPLYTFREGGREIVVYA